MKRLARIPSPSMLVALTALFISLGGTGYAVVSITGKNVKNSSLTGRDIRNGSVRSPDVAGLRARDFRRGELPSGAQGPKGDQGEKGDKGDSGQPGPAGARAYALVDGENCSGPPVRFCPLLRNKGVAYAVRVAEGRYCVGVSGISAADSIASVTVATGGLSSTLLEARWRSQNVACASPEFEVETGFVDTVQAQQADGTGSVTVAAPHVIADDRFAIAIP